MRPANAKLTALVTLATSSWAALLAAQDGDRGTVLVSNSAQALASFIEHFSVTVFLLTLVLPVLLPFLFRAPFARRWVWVAWPWKRCLVAAIGGLILALLLVAVIVLPGPWRSLLKPVGVDPAYFELTDDAIAHPGLWFALGAGRVPLFRQVPLLLLLLTAPPLVGALLSWLLHRVWGRVSSMAARGAAR
jgi:hypothetical protein